MWKFMNIGEKTPCLPNLEQKVHLGMYVARNVLLATKWKLTVLTSSWDGKSTPNTLLECVCTKLANLPGIQKNVLRCMLLQGYYSTWNMLFLNKNQCRSHKYPGVWNKHESWWYCTHPSLCGGNQNSKFMGCILLVSNGTWWKWGSIYGNEVKHHVQHMMIPCMGLEHHVSALHLWKSL